MIWQSNRTDFGILTDTYLICRRPRRQTRIALEHPIEMIAAALNHSLV